MSCQARKCPGTPSHPWCIYVDIHSTWVPNVTQNPWYLTSCKGHERHWWTLTRLGSFLVVAWSILCIYPHSSWQGSTATWWCPVMNPKGKRLKIVRAYFHPSSHSRLPTSPWCGGDFEKWKSNLSPTRKIINRKYPSGIFNHLSTTFSLHVPNEVRI